MKFPEHKASLTLVHNDHKSYYKTVAQSIKDNDHGYNEWINTEQMQKAIDTNECWYLQWYPETPNSFYIIAAFDLDVLLFYCDNLK